MNEHFCRGLRALVLVVMLSAAGVILVSRVMADPDVAAPARALQTGKTLDRELEPVIVGGAGVEGFTGLPVDELLVYSYTDGVWRQIPAQVDEVTATGEYTATEDELLDANDEILFMAKDLGDRAEESVPMVDGYPACVRWYEIEVTDPISPSQQGWAYLVHSGALTSTLADDYVTFDPDLHRIDTASYSLSFASTHSGFGYLALGGSGVNILDRTKTRVYPQQAILPVLTEDTLSPPPDDLVKDGPVRAIVRGGKTLAYQSVVWRTITIGRLIPPYDKALRFSTDFSETVSGSTYYNAAAMEGVTVDGITDTIPATPLSPWWQLSTNDGTLVQVCDTSSIGGEQTNYFRDDSATDPDDTGDGRSYGDTGVYIDAPHDALTYTFSLYFPPGSQPNVGATYESFFTHPLSITTRLRELAGQILESEHVASYTPEEVAAAANVPSSPYGAEVYRLLYLSQAPLGSPQAVSGVLMVPTGTVPGGGFPVVAHGHGTRGIADHCTPSDDPTAMEELLSWISDGFLVSATDYVGLGTPGLHPYIVGEAEAFSMLDSARAALRFYDTARGIEAPTAANQIVLEGYSQGGHAALFAHEEWPGYAPELNVLGTVAFAPGSEIRFLARQVADGMAPLLKGPITLAMYAYSQYYGAPERTDAWLMEPYATELPDQVENQWCVLPFGLSLLLVPPDALFQPDLLSAVREDRWEDAQPWARYMDVNTPGNYSSDVPALILHGLEDDLVPSEASERLLTRLCLHGTPTQLSFYPELGHGKIIKDGHAEAMQWVADRVAGVPAPNSCPEQLFYVGVPLVYR
jgi:pimeloyl-ACP methyl ester carboxylesterase